MKSMRVSGRSFPCLSKFFALSLGLAVAGLSVPSVRAANQTWDGGPDGTGTDFGLAANWTNNALPSTNDTGAFNGTAAGDLSLSYTSGLSASGSGLIISLASTQTNSVTIDSGASTTALRIGGITIASGAGAFTLGNGSDIFNVTLGNAGGSTQTFTNDSTNTATLKSDIVFAQGGAGAHILVIGGSGNWAFENIIASNISVTKSGSGTLTLSAANTYTNSLTTINGGILSVSKLANSGNPSGIGAGGIAATNLIIDGGTLQYTGVGDSTNRLFTIGASGAALDASGASNAAVNFTNTGSLVAAGSGDRTLTLTGASTGANTLTSVIVDPGSGKTGLTKSGAGTWRLLGANTYTGTTSITAGTLVLAGAGSIAQSSVIAVGSSATWDVSGVNGGNYALASGQTIKGGGTIVGNLTIGSGSVLNPGDSPGTLSQIGNQTWAGEGTYLWEINSLSGSEGGDPGWDLMSITGNLDITATEGAKFTLQIDSLSALAGWDNLDAWEWKIAAASEGISNFDLDKFALSSGGFADQNPLNGSFSLELRNGDTEMWLTYSPVPEPGVIGLFSLGLAALWWRSRHRRNARA